VINGRIGMIGEHWTASLFDNGELPGLRGDIRIRALYFANNWIESYSGQVSIRSAACHNLIDRLRLLVL